MVELYKDKHKTFIALKTSQVANKGAAHTRQTQPSSPIQTYRLMIK